MSESQTFSTGESGETLMLKENLTASLPQSDPYYSAAVASVL
jgi:hypothetical protein